MVGTKAQAKSAKTIGRVTGGSRQMWAETHYCRNAKPAPQRPAFITDGVMKKFYCIFPLLFGRSTRNEPSQDLHGHCLISGAATEMNQDRTSMAWFISGTVLFRVGARNEPSQDLHGHYFISGTALEMNKARSSKAIVFFDTKPEKNV